jgi:hypothetical protein
MPTFDVHFQPMESSLQLQGKGYSFGYTSPIAVAGPQKLINRWVKCFLTARGSDPHNKTYGTLFPTLYGSNITSYQDLADAIHVSVDDCNQQIATQDRVNQAPDDERLQAGAVEQIIPNSAGDGFDVYISVTNVAGLTVTLQLPTVTT